LTFDELFHHGGKGILPVGERVDPEFRASL
jgi:hypothetical protein